MTEASNLKLQVSRLTKKPEVYIGRVNKRRDTFLERRVCTGEFMAALVDYVLGGGDERADGIEMNFTLGEERFVLTLETKARQTARAVTAKRRAHRKAREEAASRAPYGCAPRKG